MKTRSVDDIRNFWSLKLYPLLVPASINRHLTWTEEEDLDLLVQVYEQDVDREIEIDFEDIDNEKTAEENAFRWSILIKGLGGIMPGQQVRVKEVCMKMLKDIKTKNERYVPWQSQAAKQGRNGKNQYINIVDYFRKHFLR